MDILIQIRESALNMLARREQSQSELRQKLLSRFKDNREDIEDVLFKLIEDNYQSDQRFCESYIRYKQQSGYGKIRILGEIKQKGVKQEIITQSFDESDLDWFESALKVKLSKFGPQVSQDYQTKAKQYRYLQYRGFTSDQINYAIQEDINEL